MIDRCSAKRNIEVELVEAVASGDHLTKTGLWLPLKCRISILVIANLQHQISDDVCV